MKTVLLTSLTILTLGLHAFSTEGEISGDRIVIGGLNGLDPLSTTESYPVLLALSGGGARGLSSIGVLKAFEERNIKVQALAGTSIGGTVGGLYACGHTPDELIEIVQAIDFDELFASQPGRTTMFLTQRQARERHLITFRFDGFRPTFPQGLTAAQELTALLVELTARADYRSGGDFSRLPIPLKTVCTDVVSGDEVVFSQGSLAEATRATMGFPLAFTGVERRGQILMDGGLVRPVPVSTVREMTDSAAFVVAVNTTSPLRPKEALATPLDIANQVTSIMTVDKLREQLQLADYVITPPIDDVSLSDFDHAEEIIEAGYQAGLQAADSIIAQVRTSADIVPCLIERVDVQIHEMSAGTTDTALTVIFRERLQNRKFTRQQLIAELKELCNEHDLFEIDAHFSRCALVGGADSGLTEVAAGLTLKAYPNIRVTEFEMEFDGAEMFDDTTLGNLFDDRVGYYGRQEFRAGLDRIAGLYEDSGWDLAHVRGVVIDYDRREIAVRIDEGIIRRIDVRQNETTRDWLVRSYFPLKVGEPYSTAKARDGIANIYGTDLYERVTLGLTPEDGGVVVTIGLKEKNYNQVRLGWHWDDAYQSEEFVEVLNDNVGGIGTEFLVHARYGRDRQEYRTHLRANRILSTYLTSRLSFFYRNLDRTIFDLQGDLVGVSNEKRWGGSLRIGQQMARFGTVSGQLTVEEVDQVEHRKGLEDIPYRFGLRTLTFQSLVETFDRATFPTSGNRYLFNLSFAGKFLGGDVEYTRYFSSLEAYFPFGRHLNFHARLSTGISRTGLPPSEKFYIGGQHSFSGFRTYELRGDKMFLLNTEVRLRLPLRLYLFARYDTGEVYESADEIKLRNLRHGTGLALALDSPIGPIEFGYGVADRDHDRYYFSAGINF